MLELNNIKLELNNIYNLTYLKMSEKTYHIRAIIGVIFILSGVYVAAFTELGQVFINALINAGMIILIFNYAYRKKYLKKPLRDERSIQLGNKSLGQSWTATFLVLNVLFWVAKASQWNITLEHMFGTLFIVMLTTAYGFNYYNQKHGE